MTTSLPFPLNSCPPHVSPYPWVKPSSSWAHPLHSSDLIDKIKTLYQANAQELIDSALEDVVPVHYLFIARKNPKSGSTSFLFILFEKFAPYLGFTHTVFPPPPANSPLRAAKAQKISCDHSCIAMKKEDYNQLVADHFPEPSPDPEIVRAVAIRGTWTPLNGINTKTARSYNLSEIFKKGVTTPRLSMEKAPDDWSPIATEPNVCGHAYELLDLSARVYWHSARPNVGIESAIKTLKQKILETSEPTTRQALQDKLNQLNDHKNQKVILSQEKLTSLGVPSSGPIIRIAARLEAPSNARRFATKGGRLVGNRRSPQSHIPFSPQPPLF